MYTYVALPFNFSIANPQNIDKFITKRHEKYPLTDYFCTSLKGPVHLRPFAYSFVWVATQCQPLTRLTNLCGLF